MVKLIIVGVTLFVLAVLVIVLTRGQDIAGLFNGFAAVPLIDKMAWLVVVLVPLVLLPSAVLLCNTLVRQRQAARALELRLDGVRGGVKDLARSQLDAEAALHHLARTDPEDTINAVQQRLAEAEHITEVHQNRNEIGDLQSRVDDLRTKQDDLKNRLGPVLDKRRSIEQLFIELGSRQNDIERALAEIFGGGDAAALDLRLKKLMEFVRGSHSHCDEIEQALTTITNLKRDYAELGARLAPLADGEEGVASRVKQLTEARDILAAEIESLQRTPQGNLADRVQSFAGDKKNLDDGVSNLHVQFAKLASLRDDIEALFANFDRALELLAIGNVDTDIDTRVEELATFIGTTQAHVADIERRFVLFGQLRAKLGDLQSRLVPLEAEDGGVLSVIEDVRDVRNRLIDKIAMLERGDDGDLAARVKTLTETKQELEERVSTVTEQFSKLVTIRKDIAGLFDKLTSTVSASN
jgi:chromosome segregation ATPase